LIPQTGTNGRKWQRKRWENGTTDILKGTMNLLHYSPKVLTLDALESRTQNTEPSVYEKPKGFWVSVEGEDDWASWCKAEDFGIAPLAHLVKTSPDANLLTLNSSADIRDFTLTFGKQGRFSELRLEIDWRKVAEQFQGIVIAPYQWSCRLAPETSWYYIWDCASGCIWDCSAIEGIERVPELDPLPLVISTVKGM